ncbi:MocE family 2Fe-2S type ferredoxin [Roseibium sp. HPY-6]|uniref:MocE family 2Fe-2S type ferredoxin n=1 Tax=Roseibium sp. HPY-6 TaxID=3229852 RepID=UPI00338E4BBF
MMADWVRVCARDEIEPDDMLRFDHDGRTFVIYRTENDEFFASDGLCTHEQVHLEDGLLMDYVIECPKHNGRFDIRTGEGLGAPICEALATYNLRFEGEDVLVEIP